MNGDEKSLQKNINDELIYRYTMRIPYPYTIRDAREWIKKCAKMKKKKIKKSLIYAIDVDSEVVGAVGIENIQQHNAEIGYWLARKLWNKGIATEAIRIVTRIGFSNLKLKRIYAYVIPQNKASCRVLEKNHYKLEWHLRKDCIKDGRYFDTHVYAKVK